jgi:fatty acid desaturase
MPNRQPPVIDAKTKLIAAWVGVVFTLIAIIGFLALPAARLVWIVLLIFGVATIPQVVVADHFRRGRKRSSDRAG